MTNRTLPPISPSDAEDIIDEIVAAVVADDVMRSAAGEVLSLLAYTPPTEWTEHLWIKVGRTPMASWLTQGEADDFRPHLGAHERIWNIERIVESVVIDARLDSLAVMLQAGEIPEQIPLRTRFAGIAIGLALFAVVAAAWLAIALATARPAGAAEGPSCSLHVLAIEPDAIVWGYTPPDNVVRGIHLPGGAWVALTIGGKTRTPIVDTISYPSAGDRIAVADLMCGLKPNPPSTTTPPATTSTTAVLPTTSTTTSSTVAPSTTTTEQATTTTAKARPAIVCPANTWLQLTTTAPGDNFWTMTALIGGQPTEVFATEPVWISTWTFVRPTQVEVDAPVAADCIPAVPVGPPVTEPAPVLTTLAITPAPDLPPATIPTTASSDPAPTTVPQVVVGGELPRTGPGYVLLTIGVGLLLLAAGGLVQMGRRS